jgi:acyl-lipid omega-6 desaturase (Delta-12 desaturase)
MNTTETKHLRASVDKYTQRSMPLALLIFFTEVIIYLSAIAGIIFVDNILVRILCSMIAGLIISALYVIAHDGAHNSFTGSKRLNKLIARVSYLPSLHNYSLWLIAHNRLHHNNPNVQGINSWWPYSKNEYDSLPGWRKMLERFYRSIFGMCFYYLIERWWKYKFYPYEKYTGARSSGQIMDFLLLVVYLVTFIGMLVYAGMKLAHTSPAELIVLGFVMPFLIWNFMGGATIYQHHTHESLPWFRSNEERKRLCGQEAVTMHVRYPRWYNFLSLNIMEHTAHHVNPGIPLYNLAKAQDALSKILGNKLVTVQFSGGAFLKTVDRCKLYDYEHHRWLDFDGNPTSGATIASDGPRYANAA